MVLHQACRLVAQSQAKRQENLVGYRAPVFNHPTDTFNLIIIDCDKFHLLRCLATQQEGELFLDNHKLYQLLLLGGLGVL